jgi:N-acetylglucosaminyl-diphospho-decaprenol L-rhamnosyltransferase
MTAAITHAGDRAVGEASPSRPAERFVEAATMRVSVSLVLVGYRSSDVIGAATASFRAEAARAGVDAEVVVVDHSEDDAELERLRPHADRLLARPNRGYAAGVNAGVAASTGTVLFVGNPDIAFEAGSVEGLLGALGAWDVVGPQFVLGDWFLPPGDVQTPREEVRRWRASRSRPAWRRHLRRETGRWLTAWTAGTPVAGAHLIGALIAFERRAWDLVGPWDEGYFLYFEERDWLARAERRGLRRALVPTARVTHRWAHAAEPTECVEHFLASRRRFFPREFGWLGRAVLSLAPGRLSLKAEPLPDDASVRAESTLWLLSPSPLGFPAAGLIGPGRPPLSALDRIGDLHSKRARFTLLAVDLSHLEPLDTWTWEAQGHGAHLPTV